jgi:intracellular sulfur oxidation DsrE/DsrF family protein
MKKVQMNLPTPAGFGPGLPPGRCRRKGDFLSFLQDMKQGITNREVSIMDRKSRVVTAVLVCSVCWLLAFVPNVSSQEYASLKGLTSVKAIFDVRIGDPKVALLHLKLIHQTFKDSSITAITQNPDFVVVFMDRSVKLVSKNREGFPPEDAAVLDDIAATLSEMAKDGIRLEICLFAAHVFGVDPASILPEFKQVGNGWISSIGYQAMGYSLIPAY